MEKELYEQILNDFNLALEFKKKAEIFRGRLTKSLDELGEIFHNADGKYTLEIGKEFISNLSSNNDKWHYGSNTKYSNYLSFTNVKNKIKIKSKRRQYFN